MEINITKFFTDADPLDYSASVAELGHNAGAITWRAACEDADNFGPMLDTPEKLQAMRDFARSSGGWDADEIAAWTDIELNALFVQWVAGDIREVPGMTPNSWDWDAYEALTQTGTVPSHMFRDDHGQIYFDLSE